MMNTLFTFDAADSAADISVAAAAAVRAAASMPLCFRWRRFRPVEPQTLAGGEGGSPSSIQFVYLVGEPGSLSALP